VVGGLPAANVQEPQLKVGGEYRHRPRISEKSGK
jgi:hypothetical protein